MTPTAIHIDRPNVPMVAGGENNMMNVAHVGTTLASIQTRRLPSGCFVRSLKYPTIGSATASHTREMLKMIPITAGAISSTSVENFMTYSDSKRNMYPAPTPGAP